MLQVSIVIPTHNRPDSLETVLTSLSRQSYSKDLFEVIVVEDGSKDAGERLSFVHYPFHIDYYQQDQSGPATARNRGSQMSSGDILLFLDDDVILSKETVHELVKVLENSANTVALGFIQPVASQDGSVYSKVTTAIHPKPLFDHPYEVDFNFCMTGLLAVQKNDFLKIGMFQDPTGGWPNWDDVEFGYRAFKKGYRFLVCPDAIGFHQDTSIESLRTSCHRSERAGYSAATLLNKYPEIGKYLPLFVDKIPIRVGQDSPHLIIQKLFHMITSWNPILKLMELIARLLEHLGPHAPFLPFFYRWISSGYVYRGFHKGLKSKN